LNGSRRPKRITPGAFFQTLAEIESERVQKTIELRAKSIDGQLHFTPSPELFIEGNKVIIGN
jgi:hypothetical protein